MDRRKKNRLDVQLTCYIEAGRVAATPIQAFTENVSRTGILMRWLGDIPLPSIDSGLILDIVLPDNPEFGQRFLRCRTSVVRVSGGEGESHEVALRIRTMRFIKSKLDLAALNLAKMPLATERVS